MKQHKHLGVYALIIKDNKIVLINKVTGPYDGKLDLPGGTIEFGETPEKALLRELKEEVGIEATDYEIYDANSANIRWNHNGELVSTHHIGIFYKVNDYKGEISKNISVDEINDDSMGADFYEICKLTKNEISDIAYLELIKLGYEIE